MLIPGKWRVVRVKIYLTFVETLSVTVCSTSDVESSFQCLNSGVVCFVPLFSLICFCTVCCII